MRNVGFDDDLGRLEDSILSSFLLIPATMGAEVRVGPIFGTASLSYRLESIDDLDLGISFSTQIGLRL